VAFFDVFGLNFTAGRQGVAEELRHDMFQAVNSNAVPWQISGLAPNASYELILYGGQDNFGSGSITDTRFELDLNGDTVLDTSTDVTFTDAAVYFPSVLADSAGVLRGTFAQISGNDPGTGSWQGLQLSGPRGIPEPSSCVLALLGCVGAWRWRYAPEVEKRCLSRLPSPLPSPDRNWPLHLRISSRCLRFFTLTISPAGI